MSSNAMSIMPCIQRGFYVFTPVNCWLSLCVHRGSNRNMGLETEAGATDIKSFTLATKVETTTTINYTNTAAELVDAGSDNNNDDEERISLAESARETRRTHAAAAALLLLSRSGTAMGRERNTNRKEIGVTVLSARTKKITGQPPN
ncbi:unnamed protein product [Sphagnum troendelagicum]|uniref:Uncharacterized protein n=1 Tax=Sphagnum troendelagicum TaxID=128251 RepID=A0ABP0TCC6_9BRYO